jgi:hypothetical protein
MAETSAVIRLSATDDGATSTIEKVGGAATNSSNSTANLKKELRELQKQLTTLDPNSKAFQELSIKAGQVKDQINDAAEAVRANAGNAFEGLSNNAGLLGDRLLNLDFEGVASAAQGLGANIGRIDFKSLSAGIASAGTAFASLGKALLTNPIFLVAASLALIISYWGDIKAAAVSVTAEEEKALKIKYAKAEASKKEVDNFRLQENSLRLQGMSEKDILKLRIEKINKQIADTKNALEGEKLKRKAQEASEQKYYDATKAILTFLQAPVMIILDTVDAVLKGLNYVGIIADDTYASIGDLSDALVSMEASFLFDPEASKAENAKFIEEQEKAIAELQSQADGYQLSLRDMDKKTTDVKIKETKTRTEDAKTAAEDIAKIEEEQMLAKMSATNRELYLAEKKYKELTAKANGNKDEIAKLETLKEAEINAINEKAFLERQAAEQKREQELIEQNAKANEIIRKNNEETDKLRLEYMQDGIDKELAMRAAKFDADILAAEGNAEAQKLITEKYVKDVAAIEEKAASESLKKKLDQVQTWGKLTGDAFKAISDLDKAFQKDGEKNNRAAFNRNKAYSIAQAIIQTGLAVTAALTAGGNPVKLATGKQFIEAGIAATVGLAQVATIAKTQYNAGGGTSASSSSSSIPSAGAAGGGGGGGVAQFNPLNTNFVNNRPNQVSQTYVLAGDVANAQEARNRVQDLARL